MGISCDQSKGKKVMKDFKGRHFEGTVILGCIRWYCKSLNPQQY